MNIEGNTYLNSQSYDTLTSSFPFNIRLIGMPSD
jgi:hypothetical protein